MRRAGRVGRPIRPPPISVAGKVKWFDDTKGFGFVSSNDGGKDIFVHISILGPAGLSHLAGGPGGQHARRRHPQGPRGAVDLARLRPTGSFGQSSRAGASASALFAARYHRPVPTLPGRGARPRRLRATTRLGAPHASLARHRPPPRDHGGAPHPGHRLSLGSRAGFPLDLALHDRGGVRGRRCRRTGRHGAISARNSATCCCRSSSMRTDGARRPATSPSADVVEAITTKLVRRHPHVFGDTQRPHARSASRRCGTSIKQRPRRPSARRGAPTGSPRHRCLRT